VRSAAVRIRIPASQGTATTASRSRPSSARGLADAEVALLGDDHAQAPVQGRPGGRLRVGGDQARAGLVAGDVQRLQVGLRAAAREDPVGVIAEPDALGRPVDEPPLDHRAAAALVPRVQRRVDRREDRLAQERRDCDGAVEVREVARVVEVDGVAQVDPLDLVEGDVEVAERRVEVDPRDRRLELLRRHAREGRIDLGEPGGDAPGRPA
jgi:hypothetical protein